MESVPATVPISHRNPSGVGYQGPPIPATIVGQRRITAERSMKETPVQPIGGVHFPMSFAMVGSVIPGELRRYPVRIVNYNDLTSAIAHRVKPFDPVKQFPKMHEENARGHPLMEKLKQMLQSQGKPLMQEGYERLKEDLSWRGQSAPQGPQIRAI